MSIPDEVGHLDPDAVELLPDEAGLAALWNNVRLVVVDTETTEDGGTVRVVSLAVVTCRDGFVRGRWQTLIDPGVHIDPKFTRIHGITDAHVQGEPVFADSADQLRSSLTPSHDDELVVFVAHNVNFDAPVLRDEFVRIAETMPDVRVLDTAGRLAAAVGVKPEDRSLVALCKALDINHDRPHDAMADATVCAEAVVKLIEFAALRGERDFTALLDTVSGDATTLTVQHSKPRSAPGSAARVLPSSHTETHSSLLTAQSGKHKLAAWEKDVMECAELRCPFLDDRVASAGPKPPRLLPHLEAVLDGCLTAGDIAGAATVLHPMLPMLEQLGPKSHQGRRSAALTWSKKWGPRLVGVGRCSSVDRCPACERREPCALDLWADAVAVAAYGTPSKAAAGLFFQAVGTGTGTYFSWRKQSHGPVADAALWRCIEEFRNDLNQSSRARQMAQLAWHAGCYHPDIADDYAQQLANAGDIRSLRSALFVCRYTLRKRGGSTHEGWRRLQGRARYLAGQIDRMRLRPSGMVDANGNPIPKKPHNPINPKRPPRRRFQRGAARQP